MIFVYFDWSLTRFGGICMTFDAIVIVCCLESDEC